MKDVVNAMIHKYGPEEVLSEIARGFASVADEIPIDTEHNKLLKNAVMMRLQPFSKLVMRLENK